MKLLTNMASSSSSFSSSSFPDIWTWIQDLPPIMKWTSNSMSIPIYSSSSFRPSLKLSISKKLQSSSHIILSLFADYNISISLWTSKPIRINPKTTTLLDYEDNVSKIFLTLIDVILQYCPNKNISLFKLPKLSSITNFKEMFNFSFLTLSFLICIYEAPSDLRSECLHKLKDQYACEREVSKFLMRILGSNIEEQWMRAVNLAITNWIVEVKATKNALKTPSPLFSYGNSTFGMWKVQLYCPLIAMDLEKSSNPSPEEKLVFSMNYHQVEGVIQLNHRVIIRESWIEVIAKVDNIRCDIVKLVNDTLMKERGAGKAEKHFPSRISLQLTPIQQMNVLSISVSKSSENPVRDISSEKSIEGSLNPPNTLGLSISAGETVTVSLKPWKFEQSVYGNSGNLNWYLHDSVNGREVFSSKPSMFSLINPRAWFKNRYKNVYRPFTRQGGIIFAEDEYGENVVWKVDKSARGKVMEWEIRGWIWLTYWPNKHRTFYTETRRLEFREIVNLTLA
ncbi:uncharacterized protein LOC141676689 [Apium graveolens]|uniref:uncharacterized protein LOC141676689 n=1 Tax=Apium graveolens TaxID=4045 RepID=UPI003D7B20F7